MEDVYIFIKKTRFAAVIDEYILISLNLKYLLFYHLSRKAQYKDVYRIAIEILQRTCNFQVNCCLKVHNAPLKLPSPISG